jgi:hypothetical protein
VPLTPGRGIQNDAEQSYDPAPESAIGAPQMRTESRARTTAVGDLIEAPNGTSACPRLDR